MKYVVTLFTAIMLLSIQLPAYAQDFSPNANEQSLLDLVDENEQIRVIVTLDIPFRTDVSNQPGMLDQQRAAIAATTNQILERNQDAGFENVRTYNNLPHIAMNTDRRGLIALFNDPDIRVVQIDELSAPFMDVSNAIIGSPLVWDLGFTGEGTVVAVLDSGVEVSHPHFNGQVVTEACFSTVNTSLGSTSLCPDSTEEQFGPGAGDDCDTAIAGCGHGTHVAGTIAGSSTNGGRAIDGVA